MSEQLLTIQETKEAREMETRGMVAGGITYTDPDGYSFRAFSTMYMDWGLEITKEGETLYYSPSALSNDSYGFHECDEAGDCGCDDCIGEDSLCDSCKKGCSACDSGERVEWTKAEWLERLENEAWDFLEGYCTVVD